MPVTPGGITIPQSLIDQRENKLKGLMFSLAQEIFRKDPHKDPSWCFERAKAFHLEARKRMGEDEVPRSDGPDPSQASLFDREN